MVNPCGLSVRAAVVKGTSVRLLDATARRDGLDTSCGDVGNAFVNAHPSKKAHCRAGSKFGAKEGCVIPIVKALHDLAASANRRRSLFLDFLQSLGFQPSRCGHNAWL